MTFLFSLSLTVIIIFLCLGNLIPAPTNALYNASLKFLPIPRHSPVDFISGPSDISAPFIFSNENTGILTATKSGSLRIPVPNPISFMLSPQIALVASDIIGTPVTLLIYGTVLDDLGFTSITYTSSPSAMNCMFIIPFICRAFASLFVYSTILDFTVSLKD